MSPIALQSFKNLLDAAANSDDDSHAKIAILRQYLSAVKPRDSGEDAVFLADIMETWSFAAQIGDDGVMSSAAVVLALVLQVVSQSLELVSHGLGICQTLVQERQLKSISRNLSAEKGKGFIISPTLRLLREAVCLDGGACAKRIFRARLSTCASLGRNLEIGPNSDSPEDFRRASVRTNAVRFLLSCFKYLNSDAKKELVSQRELMSHLTFTMKNDPPHIIFEILESLKSNVFMDTGISRDAKFRNFNTKILMRFLALYSYNHPHADAQDVALVPEKAHEFMVSICTNTTAGILYPCHGLYPKDTEDEPLTIASLGRPENIDADFWGDRFRKSVPVYNFVLSEVASKLRPWSSLKHNELLIAIFKAAPELIADYFFNNRAFTFEPKLTMTWIGYAAFLFNTMSIPLPASFGDSSLYTIIPPPTPILLDNIIPQPINQKVLIRCLTPSSNLTSMFAMRILVLALEKLSKALKMLSKPHTTKSAVWNTASRKLTDAFCQRMPDMKEVVRCYKAIPKESSIHRTIASRLLRHYYETVPQIALGANFDVSPFFPTVLSIIQDETVEAEARAFAGMELENLVSIASYSPGMRWFVKVDGLHATAACSTYTAMLRLLCNSSENMPLLQLRAVLSDVAIENQLVSAKSKLVPLIRALRCAAAKSNTDATEVLWSYMDNCISRCATSPIKYLDSLDSIIKDEKLPDNEGLSLFVVCLLEQIPFVAKTASASTQKHLATFASLYFTALQVAGEDESALQIIFKQLLGHLPEVKSTTSKKFGDAKIVSQLADCGIDDSSADQHVQEDVADSTVIVTVERLKEMLHVPFDTEEDGSTLLKWATKTVDDLVEDNWVAKLIRLLSSEHTHIRKEALTNILKMAAKIDESSYEEKKQVWLLLSELAESSKVQIDSGPVPSFFIAFATHALEILKNPLHPLYPKVNTYLTRSPVWPLEKLPMAHDILHGEPSEDDKYYTEATWLLTYLLDGLRSPYDLGVFHKKRWFEKILALGSNPYMRANLRTRILRIVYRSTLIEGGSTTLVTRFGLLSWLDSERVACGSPEDAAVYSALMKQVWETCDQARVSVWSKGGITKLMQKLEV